MLFFLDEENRTVVDCVVVESALEEAGPRVAEPLVRFMQRQV
jgi:hypothetical protein